MSELLDVDPSEPCADCGHSLAQHPGYEACADCGCTGWAMFGGGTE